MISATNRFTAVLDASVLFPNMKRDILLRFHEADLYRARWTEKIQQEWLVRARERFPDNVAKLDRTDALMREHFEDCWVGGHEKFIPIVDLPNDPDDNHVVAAAIACKAQYIVTDNVRDFPPECLEPFDLERGTADHFLSGTFDHFQYKAFSVLREHRRGLRSQPGATEYLMNLRQKGLPMLAARLLPMKDSL
ncbi:PIN domain-containing protein [Tropicimonas isoalkanivorans]|uniref:PIN domain-containing protein n=1 Tax=Tropicimonas isoalkanivorans TaxID=441112 RepID=A0A1I1PXX8_9RHOB|nr:PIN domain-containing protein [Tropicimonas isoalkanivorans]SFD14679.1 PIN domain-containing protein [Tropicimonas isoalkanivorans]